MLRLGANSASLLLLFFGAAGPIPAQTPGPATAPLREVRVEGQKHLSEAQLVALTGLAVGSEVERSDLQAAADKLSKTGLFDKVSYNFETRTGVIVTYHVEESPRIPAYFDNIPWFADSEVSDAIRRKLPYFDGTLPQGGDAVEQAAEAIKDLITSHGFEVTLEHQVTGNPIRDGSVQLFKVEGPALRFTGNPNQKLPQQVPVLVPVDPGPVYHWKEAHWAGNVTVSEFTLNGDVGLKPSDVAEGMQIEAGWDR